MYQCKHCGRFIDKNQPNIEGWSKNVPGDEPFEEYWHKSCSKRERPTQKMMRSLSRNLRDLSKHFNR